LPAYLQVGAVLALYLSRREWMTGEKVKLDLTEIRRLVSALTAAEARPDEQLRILQALQQEARRLLTAIPKNPKGET
jgi:hypothetical protein